MMYNDALKNSLDDEEDAKSWPYIWEGESSPPGYYSLLPDALEKTWGAALTTELEIPLNSIL